MKDSLALSIFAVVLAAGAWAFWSLAGQGGFNVLTSLALLLVVADNIRLRRRLRKGR